MITTCHRDRRGREYRRIRQSPAGPATRHGSSVAPCSSSSPCSCLWLCSPLLDLLSGWEVSLILHRISRSLLVLVNMCCNQCRDHPTLYITNFVFVYERNKSFFVVAEWIVARIGFLWIGFSFSVCSRLIGAVKLDLHVDEVIVAFNSNWFLKLGSSFSFSALRTDTKNSE